VAAANLATNSNKQLTIAVDFDGVIADYDGGEELEAPGAPRGDVVEALKVLHGEGWRIVIYSCRETEVIRTYLTQNAIPFDEINPSPPNPAKGPKPRATVYWDDRAWRYSGNALEDLEKIRNFRT
jgi:hypothetical protein